jgi:hypothetical protein
MIRSSLPRWWFSLLSTISGIALMAGLDRPAAPPAAPADKHHTSGTTGWNVARRPAATPGIDQATVHWYARDGRVVYVVWTDLPGGPRGAFGHGVTAKPGRARQGASLQSIDGRQFDLLYERAREDGVEVVRCMQGRYPLDRGRLLLVTALGQDPRVTQLPLDSALADLLADPAQSEDGLRAGLRAYGLRSPDVRRHFTSRAALT